MEISATHKVYFPRMMKFEINSESFAVNVTNVETNLEFSSFNIKLEFFGLIKDLKFYTDYIIGAVSFDKKKIFFDNSFYYSYSNSELFSSRKY